jgi:transposase
VKAPKDCPQGFEQVNWNAAGIDVGSTLHMVAVPPGRSTRAVREFEAFTSGLYELAEWLQECEVETVAMEATGSYWINLYQILEEHGFEVILTDTRRLKNVPARKSDVLDCQWLQQLHTFGLLKGAFRPDDQTVVLRSYMRHRQMLVECASEHIQHMQKALTEMNVKLQHVVSDITGVTGLKIIRAILRGERSPDKLAALRHGGCKNDEETIAKALHGHYREEHVFQLRQGYDLYEMYRGKISECDEQIEGHLKTYRPKGDVGRLPEKPKRKRRKNQLHFDGRSHLYRITGVDLTAIDGIDEHTALKILSETGLDMTRWPTTKAFSGWLSLCPGTGITGGKSFSSRSRPNPNRAAAAFRVGARSLHRSSSASGAYLRRHKARQGAPAAITTTAHRLARIFYSLLRHGGTYVDEGQEAYEHRYRKRQLQNIRKRARAMGYDLVKHSEDPAAA